MRVGDAERDAAATRLGTHLTAGRLQWDEYDQRLQAAYAAKTRGDLAKLFTDLPEEAASARGRAGRQQAPDRSPVLILAAALAATIFFLMRASFFVAFLLVAILVRVIGGMLLSGPSHRGHHGGGSRRGGADYWLGPRAAWCAPGAVWGGRRRYRH